MLKKVMIIMFFITAIVFINGCSRWHTKPILQGMYDSKDLELLLFDETVIHIKVVFTEITRETFDASDQTNVFLDKSTSFSNQTYYEVLIYLKLLDHDEISLKITKIESGGIGGMKNQYWLHFENDLINDNDSMIMYIDMYGNRVISVMFTNHKDFDTEWVALHWSELN